MGISFTKSGHTLGGDASLAYERAKAAGRSEEEAIQVAFDAGSAEEARQHREYYEGSATPVQAPVAPACTMSRWEHLKAIFGF